MIIYTKKHKIAFQIDEDDFEIVSRYTWCIQSKGYIRTAVPVFNDEGERCGQRVMLLHNMLMGPAPAGYEWDHWNRDKLDNRRPNLRAVTHSENCMNCVRRPSTGRPKGKRDSYKRQRRRAGALC